MPLGVNLVADFDEKYFSIVFCPLAILKLLRVTSLGAGLEN